MNKPSSSIVGLLGSEKFRSGKGNSQDLIALLKEMDNALKGVQSDAEKVASGRPDMKEIVYPHWEQTAKLRVDFLGVVNSCGCQWSDGTHWLYPKDVEVEDMHTEEQTPV
jgi:hypothetical protein